MTQQPSQKRLRDARPWPICGPALHANRLLDSGSESRRLAHGHGSRQTSGRWPRGARPQASVGECRQTSGRWPRGARPRTSVSERRQPDRVAGSMVDLFDLDFAALLLERGLDLLGLVAGNAFLDGLWSRVDEVL